MKGVNAVSVQQEFHLKCHHVLLMSLYENVIKKKKNRKDLQNWPPVKGFNTSMHIKD